ncbi:MAG: hypothetical protein ABL876_00440 [Chitinophagaceae bacterium]
MNSALLKKSLVAGLIVGTLDITAACLQNYINTGNGPVPVLRFVASGVFGNEAFTGGNAMLTWGLIFHFIIAIGFSVFFFWLVIMWPVLLKNKLLTGFVYGIFVWAFMRFVVLPLSLTPSFPFNIKKAIIAALILVFCIGIPLTFLAAPAAKKTE